MKVGYDTFNLKRPQIIEDIIHKVTIDLDFEEEVSKNGNSRLDGAA